MASAFAHCPRGSADCVRLHKKQQRATHRIAPPPVSSSASPRALNLIRTRGWPPPLPDFLVMTIGTTSSIAGMDAKTDSNKNSMPRSHPAFYGMTIVSGGAQSTRSSNAAMRLREGTGGKFGNVVLANLGGAHVGVEIKDCGAETRTQTLPSSSTSIGAAGDSAASGYLYFSSNAIMEGASSAFTFDAANGCSPPSTPWSSVSADPLIAGGTFTEDSMAAIDPRPACGSPAYSDVDTVPDSWYTQTDFKGAFGTSNWLDGWSFVNLPTQAGFVSSGSYTCPTASSTEPMAACGDITSDTMWVAGPLYVLTCQVFVRAGAVLRVQAGTTIYAAPGEG